MDEGYIKYNCNWIPSTDIPLEMVSELNLWRSRMYQHGLIGIYADGIGFGNISRRVYERAFLISGTATGGLATLNESHYSLVTDYSLTTNSVSCRGLVKASSESLTHASVYECSPETHAVIHVHNMKLWSNLIQKVPTTGMDIPYGTPEMANEVRRLFEETSVSADKIIVMGGHQEGIISFGKNLEEAGNILMEKLEVYL